MSYTVVLSLKGHDKGGLFIVTGKADDNHLLIADGRIRTFEKPKKKKSKHLRTIGEINLIDSVATNRQLSKALSKLDLPESAGGGFELVQG